MNRPNANTNEHTGRGREGQPRFLQEDALDLGVTDVLCTAEGMADGGRVFFVAGDDDDAGEDGPAIDFNVLAQSGESVAEVIGEVAARRQAEAEAATEAEAEAVEPVAVAEVVPEPVAVGEPVAVAEPAAVGEPVAIVEPESEPAAPLAVAVDSSSGEYLPASPAAATAATPAAVSAVTATAAAPESSQGIAPESRPESPRAQRNRERARRKKEKRAAKAAARAQLPEIVLARSEGTDTLLPESGAVIAVVPETAVPEAATDVPALSAAALEAALLSPDAPESADLEFEGNTLERAPAVLESAALPASSAPAEDSAQPRGPVRSLITPIDIIEENSDIISGAAAEAPGDAAEAAEETAEAQAASHEREELAEAEEPDEPAAVDDRALLLSAEMDELRLDAYDLLDDAGAGEVAEAAQADDIEDDAEDGVSGEGGMNNVILFRPAFLQAEDEQDALDSLDALDSEDSAEPDEASFAPPRLRLLPPVEENTVASGPSGEAEQGLSSLEKATLLRAIAGGAEAGVDADSYSGAQAASGEAEAENIILSGDLYSAPVDPEAELARARTEIAAELSAEITAEVTAEVTAELSAEMERTLQARADEFALRLLEAQAEAAGSEARARTSEAALLAKEKAAAELSAEKARDAAGFSEEKNRLAEELKAKTERLAASSEGIAARDARLRHFDGLQDEHEKLYTQFEDLRTAYNEIVTSAMPGLQAERDDFALTVERQVDEMTSLKSSLSGARRRLAVGYSMAAAACIMIVSLPIAGWLDSGADERAAARDMQEVAELRERADEAERQTLAAGETIIELERKLSLAAGELAKLESRSGDLSRRGREIAASASGLPGGGTPTRASTMALQATPGPGGELRVNEIRDPAGSIEQVYADNRTRREQAEGGAQMASASLRPASAPGGRIAVSAVARTSSSGKPSAKPAVASAASDSLRPESAGRTASVHAGEGVAQVVYRVMGTRDPEVINWVIRENGIKLDRRGNPRIYPEQQLRLPSRMELTASR